MKRFCSLLAAVLLLLCMLALPAAAESPEYPLCFGSFGETVNTIWAEYASDAPAGSLSVRFRDGIQGQTISNYTKGTLYVAVVSTEPLDLSEPIAWVTEAESDSAPVLTLKVLRYNEVPAAVAFSPKALDAVLDGGTVTASVTVQIPAPITCQMVTAAYRAGQMLKVDVRTVTLNKPENTVQSTLSGCTGATEAKVFFVTDVWTPLGQALKDIDL